MEEGSTDGDLTNVLKVLIGASAGFAIGWLISHPKSSLKNKLPKTKIEGFHVLPNIRLVKKDKVYRLHHWMVLASFYFPLLWKKGNFLKYKLLHGIVIGSILQGLSFKDRFNIICESANDFIDNELKLNPVTEFEVNKDSCSR
ncbi:MAG: hypothetical protein M1524_00695 [Patescibacteria group bacterium]|nr:hypothetical protein [Patescibacteria group bacterium]